METAKWQMIDHVTDDIIRSGGLFLSDAGLYWYSQIIFKKSYETTLKRRSRSMDDEIAVLGRGLCEDEGNTT